MKTQKNKVMLQFKLLGEIHSYTEEEVKNMKKLIIMATKLDGSCHTAYILRRAFEAMHDNSHESAEGEHLLMLYEHLTFCDHPKWVE